MNIKRFMTSKSGIPLIAILCTMLWGSAPPVIKYGYTESVFNVDSSDMATQILFAGARFLCAGLLLLIYGVITNGKRILPQKRDLAPIMSVGFSQTFLHYLFTFIGVAHTTATKSAIMTASSAFFSVLLAPIFFKKEKLTWKSLLGAIVGFSGIILINFDKNGMLGFSLMGEGFILIATICSVAGNFISKVVAKTRSSITLNCWQMIFGGFVLSALGTLMGGKLNFTSAKCFFVIIFLGSVSAVAFTLWTLLLVYNPAGKIGIYNLFIPIFSTVFSAILLSENIFTDITKYISILLVCAGVAIVNLKNNKVSVE